MGRSDESPRGEGESRGDVECVQCWWVVASVYVRDTGSRHELRISCDVTTLPCVTVHISVH